jgi:hypothetical protein
LPFDMRRVGGQFILVPDVEQRSMPPPPLTFVLGIYKDDEFLEFRLDSRRFEPFGNRPQDWGSHGMSDQILT